LVTAWQAGAISFETLFWNLKQSEIVENEITSEDEQARIKPITPVLPTAATNIQ
jgi:hypothetical protein